MISGSGSNLEAIIKACNTKNIYGEIVCVISNNPDAYGIERAKKYSIPIKIIDHKEFSKRDDFDNALEDILDCLDVDLIILAGFMRILGKNLTHKFYGKMINLHPSLLPLYPGLNTHAQALNELCLNNIYLNCETDKVMYSNILDSKMFVTYFNN